MTTLSRLLISALLPAILIGLPHRSPAESKKTSEHAGASLFQEKGCAYCHGSALQGTPKGPSLINVRKTLKAPIIAAQIENGGQKMPPFGDSLSHDEIMQLVLFLRAKHHPFPNPAATVEKPEQSPAIP